MPSITVTRTYLALATPSSLARSDGAPPGVTVVRERACSNSLYRQLYGEVGRAYAWTDRLLWNDETLRAHLDRAEISIWTLRVDGALAGFFELKREPDESVEIAYFGLLPAFHRRGLGKLLLTRAADEAWAIGAKRVWLHTCTLDDPAALPNYIARGFVPFKTEQYVAHISD